MLGLSTGASPCLGTIRSVGFVMVVHMVMFGVQDFNRGIDPVCHGLFQCARKAGNNNGHQAEWGGDDEDHPNRVCKSLLECRDALGNEVWRCPRNIG